jgi:hypothetical protein
LLAQKIQNDDASRPMKHFLTGTLLSILLIGCGGDSSESANTPANENTTEDTTENTAQDDVQPPNLDSPDDPTEVTSASLSINLTDYLGSLYNTFDWAGAIRDPMRDELEIQNANTYVAMNDSDKTALNELAAEHEIIAQIGGMGSAKIAPDATEASAQFSDYMSAIIADNGSLWRSVVESRATEVTESLPENATFYWQIGNEVNATSYTRNAVLYFDNETHGLSNEAFGMHVYVEYFLAPTIQSFMAAETATGKDIRIALGSVSAFSAPASQEFLTDLLDYEIEGTYAPELSGRKVHELIDLITIHYLAHAFDEDNMNHWRDTLEGLHDTWVQDNIRGIWTTEEVGINLAEGGLGAGAAITVAGRYLEWISDEQLPPEQSRWFYFGTNAGPSGQRISDATSQLYALTADTTISHMATQYHDNGLEVRSFALGDVSEREGIILLISGLASSGVALDSLQLSGETLNHLSTGQVLFARRYGMDLTEDITIRSALSNDQLTLSFEETTLDRLESLIVVVQ